MLLKKYKLYQNTFNYLRLCQCTAQVSRFSRISRMRTSYSYITPLRRYLSWYLGGAGAYSTIFKIELLVKIILSKNLNKKNVLESFFLLSFNFNSFVFRLLPYKKKNINLNFILFYFILINVKFLRQRQSYVICHVTFET